MKLKHWLTAAGMAAVLGLAASPSIAAPIIWESSFGSSVVGGDDSTANVSFGFNFSFLGGNYSGGEVSTNGFLSLGGSNGSGCCDGSVSGFLNGAARIAPAWYDLDGMTVFLNTSTAGRAVLTWQGHEFSNSSPVLMQLQLFSDGRIIFGYDSLPPLEDNGHRHDAITGVTAGGGAADPGEVNYSAALPFSSGGNGTVYEFFNRGPNGASGGSNIDTFDLAGGNICFDPNGRGGWSVGSCAANNVPEPDTLALLALSMGALVLATRRRQRR